MCSMAKTFYLNERIDSAHDFFFFFNQNAHCSMGQTLAMMPRQLNT